MFRQERPPNRPLAARPCRRRPPLRASATHGEASHFRKMNAHRRHRAGRRADRSARWASTRHDAAPAARTADRSPSDRCPPRPERANAVRPAGSAATIRSSSLSAAFWPRPRVDSIPEPAVVPGNPRPLAALELQDIPHSTLAQLQRPSTSKTLRHRRSESPAPTARQLMKRAAPPLFDGCAGGEVCLGAPRTAGPSVAPVCALPNLVSRPFAGAATGERKPLAASEGGAVGSA